MVKQDRRIQRTIQAIDNAFIILMNKKRFEQITINEISVVANINRVTFYNYYVDKYDWFEKFLYNQLSEFILLEKNLDFNQPYDEIYQLFLSAYKQANENYDVLHHLLLDKTTPFHHDLIQVSKKAFEDKIKPLKNYSKTELNFEVNYYVSLSVNLLEWWISENKPWNEETMAKKSADLLKHWII